MEQELFHLAINLIKPVCGVSDQYQFCLKFIRVYSNFNLYS